MDQKDDSGPDKRDKSDKSYRDDAEQLTDSSDYARGNRVGVYSGGGPDTSTEPAPQPKGRQDWQKGITAANDSSDEPPTTADDSENDVRSRSADPGESS